MRTFVRSCRTFVRIAYRTFVTYDRFMTEDITDVTGSAVVGQSPATGGRVRRYADGAERARAWRARQAERRVGSETPAGSGAPTGGPELAVASLAAVLPQLKETTAQQMAAFSAVAARIEAAVDLLSDPEAIDERLELARAESARMVAEAQDQAAAAKADASRARSAEQALRAERDEATESAAQAWERVGELETAATQAEEEAAQARTTHAAQVETMRAEHAAELDTRALQLRQATDDYEAALSAERAASARAEDRAAEAHEGFLAEQAARLADAQQHERQRDAAAQELSHLRAEHTAALDRVRSEAAHHEATAVAQVKESYEARLVDRDERIDDLRSQLADARADRDRVHADLAAALTRPVTGPSATGSPKNAK